MTAAQVMESDNGTEMAAALDDFATNITTYNSGAHMVSELYQAVSKVVERLNELGLTIPAPLLEPVPDAPAGA